MRIIGLDIHRAFAEAVAWEDGKIRRFGRVDMRRQLLTAFARGLRQDDVVVIEATGNAAAVAAALTPHGELPITQEDLGDTLGLSAVHVNRTLQALRAANLVILNKGHVVIVDPDRLFEFSGFNPNYLHLRTSGATAGATSTLAR